MTSEVTKYTLCSNHPFPYYSIRIYSCTTLALVEMHSPESPARSSYARDTGANVKTGSGTGSTDLPGLDGDHERSPYTDHSLTYFVLFTGRV